MSGILRPIPSETHEALDGFYPEPGSVFIYAASGEQRSAHAQEWQDNRNSVRFYPITQQSLQEFTIQVGGSFSDVRLRSTKDIDNLRLKLASNVVYLDITGLAHSTWAALVRVWLSSPIELRVVYREPGNYNYVESPTEGRTFELSESFEGVKPLPQFAKLSIPEGVPTCFVPLLGFEGARLARLTESLDPSRLKIVPILGLPGFQPDYPYNAVLGNRVPIEQLDGWPQVRYAKANCPFALLYLLESIAQENLQRHMAIGLIGTKPHALGAVLFALRTASDVELLHDHPVRSSKRTSGTDRVLVYHVSALEYPGLG